VPDFLWRTLFGIALLVRLCCFDFLDFSPPATTLIDCSPRLALFIASLTSGGGELAEVGFVFVSLFGVLARFALIVFNASATSLGGVREAEPGLLFVDALSPTGVLELARLARILFRASATSGGGTEADEGLDARLSFVISSRSGALGSGKGWSPLLYPIALAETT
jgi:hypothetical protein